jgi:NADPH2:quinone reductase
MHAIRVSETGGPEKLVYQEIELPQPQAGEALVKIAAAGVNFIDVYYRIGQYKTNLPFTPGQEASGIVEAVGPGVTEVKVGQRVAYVLSMGSYAEYAVVPASKLVPVPDGVDDQQAAAALLQGMTAHYLTHSTYRVQKDDTVLVHAAAGGVGLLLTQMVHQIGAKVIATVSTEAKAELARAAGADEIILYNQADFEQEVKRITAGAGVSVVYDSVGKTTFDKSINCLRPRGYMVLYGSSSGPVPLFDPATLNSKGSLFLTRPSLGHYLLTQQELLQRANEVLAMIEAGNLKLRIEHTYPLAQAGQAHLDLQARATTGKLLLLV